MKKKRKQIVYSTTPLFILVSFCFAITFFISIYVLDVHNFYSASSEQDLKKKGIISFCITAPEDPNNIYGSKQVCDQSTYDEFDVIEYVRENEYHWVLGGENYSSTHKCGLRKDYQFGKEYGFSHTIRKCAEKVIENWCGKKFRYYLVIYGYNTWNKYNYGFKCAKNNEKSKLSRKAEKYILKELN